MVLSEAIKCLDDVLINGDDMVYADDKHTYEKNIRLGSFFGLEMSVGKAYFHSTYLNVNSQSVHCSLKSSDKNVRFINFLNTGLFFGLHKVQGKTEVQAPPGTSAKDTQPPVEDVASNHSKQKDGIVVNLNCLLAGSLKGKESGLLKKSLSVNAETILEECKSKTYRGDYHLRNLFIKESLGGMGVNPPPGWRFKISKNDLYVASGYLHRYPGIEYTTFLPCPGPPPEAISDTVEMPWSTRDTNKLIEPLTVPKVRVTFRDLKRILRSPVFQFYMPNRNHGILNFQREKKEKS